MDKLKPCPFCGGHPVVFKCNKTGGIATCDKSVDIMLGQQLTHRYIACGRCGARTGTYITTNGLYNAWNRRVDNEG